MNILKGKQKERIGKKNMEMVEVAMRDLPFNCLIIPKPSSLRKIML